nr:YjcZ family sporulation protein [Priestia endophytica]
MSHGHAAPAYGYGVHHHGCDNFAIIVVLFILLIIIGACTFSGYKG